MKSVFLCIFLHFIVLFTARAQRICGTSEYKQQLLSSNPSLKKVFNTIEKQISSFNGNLHGDIAKRDTTSNEIIYIPVVIHLLYKNDAENISDAQIKSQLDVLNNDYSMLNNDRANTPQAFKPLAGNAGIKFCLARVDPNGNKTTGIDRKYTTQNYFSPDDGMKLVAKGGAASWDSKRYLNIWVCKLSSRSVGYATPPGAAAELDGVVISYDVFGTTGNLRAIFNKGRTGTHEVGHWLGLTHIWGDTNCGDDHVDDTPTQQSYNFGCQNFPKLSKCSPDNNGDMFMNFMDFSDDACMNLFTKGQVKRMRALFAQNNIRNSFLASFACDSTLAAESGPLPVTDPVPNPVPDPLIKLGIKVYPNPVYSITTIECEAATPQTLKTVSIFNSMGMRVYSGQLKQEKTIINLTNLASGIYVLHIGDGKNQFTTKISKL